MSKPFITYTAQVEKLKNEKNLVITDDDFAVESLQNISYYALIGGYKHPFIDIHTRKYINEACFEDIVALYEFDEELRGIFFKYLCRVERKMRSSISYHFCKKHGERQEEYLNSNNYGNIPKNKNGITKLIKMLDMMANKNKDHEYLVYQRNKYHIAVEYRILRDKPCAGEDLGVGLKGCSHHPDQRIHHDNPYQDQKGVADHSTDFSSCLSCHLILPPILI